MLAVANPRVDLLTREYLILRGDADSLSANVTDHLNNGWELAPGSYACVIFVESSNHSYAEYSQAIYREVRK